MIVVDPVSLSSFCTLHPRLTVMEDLTRRHDTRFGQVRHWLVTKYSVSSAGEVIDSRARTLSPWIAPAPIPVHHIAGYVYRLEYAERKGAKKKKKRKEKKRNINKANIIEIENRIHHATHLFSVKANQMRR